MPEEERSRCSEAGYMRRNRKYLIVGVTIVTLLISLGLLLRSQPGAIWWRATFTLRPRELPRELIRPWFRFVSRRRLPEEIEGARALSQGGADPSIFMKFRTDPNGIESICQAFTTPEAQLKPVEPSWLRTFTASGGHIFSVASRWEQRTGIQLFDQKAIESGRMLEYVGVPGTEAYTVFIDDKNGTVYIYASRRG